MRIFYKIFYRIYKSKSWDLDLLILDEVNSVENNTKKYNFELEFEKSKEEDNNIIEKLVSSNYINDPLKKDIDVYTEDIFLIK